MMVKYLLLILTALLAPLPAAASPKPRGLSTQGYELIAREHGVAVYKHHDSEMIRVGAEGLLSGTPEDVASALLDYESQRGRIDRLSESRVLARGEGWLRVYQRLNLPVIDDRDFTLNVRWTRENDQILIRYRALKRGGPAERDGVVRVSHHLGTWQLRPAPSGQTWARLTVQIDLAGWLPKWMARSGSGKEMPALFSSINKMVKQNSYRRMSWASN